jgi:hypothetical protein
MMMPQLTARECMDRITGAFRFLLVIVLHARSNTRRCKVQVVDMTCRSSRRGSGSFISPPNLLRLSARQIYYWRVTRKEMVFRDDTYCSNNPPMLNKYIICRRVLITTSSCIIFLNFYMTSLDSALSLPFFIKRQQSKLA